MLRGDCKYTECYCEENIWWICHSLANGVTDERICDAEVIFISNDARTVPLWCQKSARNPDAPVVWDYHVILAMKKDSEMFIYDLDTSLPFPCEFNDYSSQSFRSDSTLKPQYHRKFRVISGSQFLLHFASDRSHMEKEKGGWMSPPPTYPPIGTSTCTNNLQSYIDMTQSTNSAGGWLGEVLTLHQLNNRYSTSLNSTPTKQ